MSICWFPIRKSKFKNKKKSDENIIGETRRCQKIAELFKVSPRTVYNALYYKVGGKQAEEIRFWALQNGGIRLP